MGFEMIGRNCWKYQCEFRFRKRLFELGRPAKGTVGEVFRPAEQVLICYDGSPSSVALINLALNALVFGRSQQVNGSSSKLPFPFKFVIFVVLGKLLNESVCWKIQSILGSEFDFMT